MYTVTSIQNVFKLQKPQVLMQAETIPATIWSSQNVAAKSPCWKQVA